MTCTAERPFGQVLFVGDSDGLLVRVKEIIGLTPRVAYCMDEAVESLKRDGGLDLIIVREYLPATREDLETLRMAELAVEQPGDEDNIQKARKMAKTVEWLFLGKCVPENQQNATPHFFS